MARSRWESLAADSVDSSKIVNGSIATADLADASVTNAKLAADTARANLLTNGGFEIWQRGNGPFTAAGAYHADRWTINIISSDTFSVSRDTTNIDSRSGACAAVTFGLVEALALRQSIKSWRSRISLLKGRWSAPVVACGVQRRTRSGSVFLTG